MGISRIITKLFAIPYERELKRLRHSVEKINTLEEKLQTLSDAELRAQTAVLRERVMQGIPLDSLLPEAFALVRVAAKRTLNMRHFDVQLMGGMALHEGKIAEMHTGEGKTLVATLAAYLNALTGKGVHIVTVNPYLAARDAKWMGPIYEFLGLSVGLSIPGMSIEEKKAAYAADVTYATNNEVGFDYLRDNMAFSVDEKVQRAPYFVIVDEADSALIDEARTPLIISGRVQDSIELYGKINQIIPKLQVHMEEAQAGDYVVDEKSKQVHLTEAGQAHVEQLLHEADLLAPNENLYDAVNLVLLHHINAGLRAHTLFQRDVHYVISDEGHVVIIDEHTGRAMPGRRWSEGLHQAIEAKEGVLIQNESQTLASITFQNYFRQYEKLSGMTGTAATEAQEFRQIYGLPVMPIPTHQRNIRDDAADLIFASRADKFKALVDEIKVRRAKNQPVLVGTTSIEVSEILSNALDKADVPHQVLNAKFHEKEAQIIAKAGMPGAVTIATNMAGRGTDIVLGGNVEMEKAQLKDPSAAQIAALEKQFTQRHEIVVQAGGLHVMGSERHESRRIDNQLRGRCGRQGDPGSTQFYLSLEDSLMRIFASDRMKMIMKKLGLQGDQAIKSPMVSRAIENAQRKVEGYNFDIRKQLLEFDDVANDQRRVVYAQRNELMRRDDVSDLIEEIRYDILTELVLRYLPLESIEENWDIAGLGEVLNSEFSLEVPLAQWLDEGGLNSDQITAKIIDALKHSYQEKTTGVEIKALRQFEKSLLLQILDNHWKDHLAAMDYLRRSVSLRGYANKDPKQEYKREAFILFSSMLDEFRAESMRALAKFKISSKAEMEALEAQRRQQTIQDMKLEHPEAGSSEDDEKAALQPKTVVNRVKIGRNDPCHCGSGKKYKVCHGAL